jgi:hypothetical protein
MTEFGQTTWNVSRSVFQSEVHVVARRYHFRDANFESGIEIISLRVPAIFDVPEKVSLHRSANHRSGHVGRMRSVPPRWRFTSSRLREEAWPRSAAALKTPKGSFGYVASQDAIRVEGICLPVSS